MSLRFTFIFRVLNAPKLVTNLIPLPSANYDLTEQMILQFLKKVVTWFQNYFFFSNWFSQSVKVCLDMGQWIYLLHVCSMILRRGNLAESGCFCNRNSVLFLVPTRNRLLIKNSLKIPRIPKPPRITLRILIRIPSKLS